MLKINMFSSADKVKGQGVGSAYLELIKMLKNEFSGTFDVTINKWQKADISHYHTIDPLFFFSTFFKKSRGKRIGYVHFVPETIKGSLSLGKFSQRVFSFYLIAYYKRMDHLVVVNPSFIPVLENYDITEDKVTYIPNFVSTQLFYEKNKNEKEDLRAKYEISKEKFVVLGAGQIQERKGIDDFVKLAIENPEIQFIWAGGFSFGSMTDGYKKYKDIYENPPKNLKFTGIISREELADYYNFVDLFLLPSYNELFPMCILEAFNCGVPVMLRDLDLYHSIIKNQYIATKDYEEMNSQLKTFAQNTGRLEKWAAQSREASEKYSEENVAKLWYNFYMEQAATYTYRLQD